MFTTDKTTDRRRFEKLMPFILEHEGRYYEHDKDDPGGATKFGIDQRSHPTVKIRDLTEAQAVEIYWQEWLDSRAPSLPSPLAEAWFDTRVNCGPSRADRCLPLSAYNTFPGTKMEPRKAADFLLAARLDFYTRLAEGRGVFRKFLRGWTRRVEDLRSLLDLRSQV